jgi:hypothetical protein
MRKQLPGPKLPDYHDWRTTDQDEIHKRQYRARIESYRISNATREQPISRSGPAVPF